jgi:hypothetical protein
VIGVTGKPRQPLLAGIISWLRAGYPDGVPETDYLPLFALLRRRLTDDEVRQIADRLADDGELPLSRVDIGVLITRITDELPSEEDIARVDARLRSGGWHED